MFFVVNYSYPNSQCFVMCKGCWLEADLTNSQTECFDTLGEAEEFAGTLHNTQFVGGCGHCTLIEAERELTT